LHGIAPCRVRGSSFTVDRDNGKHRPREIVTQFNVDTNDLGGPGGCDEGVRGLAVEQAAL